MSGAPAWTGGCQCGAVRFRVTGLERPSICYCRMCQKAFGNIAAPLVTVAGLTWTRGTPAHFESSRGVHRGFCSECGTPLTFEHYGGVGLAICAFDDASSIVPAYAVGTDAKLPWADHLPSLPGRPAQDATAADARLAKIVSRQHPDHDTETWPPSKPAP